MSDFEYVGTELDLFERAVHWKRYFSSYLRPFIGRQVLEVGAGTGGTTAAMCDGTQADWACLEPDPALAGQLQTKIDQGRLPRCCRTVVGTLDTFRPSPPPDTILYIDVLEHIEDDAAEVRRAEAALASGGHIIALSPAHQWLYSPFDKQIGHCRRYTRASLAAIGAPGLKLRKLSYLDSVGMLASLANKALLRQSMPQPKQIALWDNAMVPISRVIDPFFLHRLGKSVIAVWQKP